MTLRKGSARLVEEPVEQGDDLVDLVVGREAVVGLDLHEPIAHELLAAGYDVTVVPTAAALEFVGAPTWAALSGKPVATDKTWSYRDL